MSSGDLIRRVEPAIIPRLSGGYLAASAPGSSLSIGVTAMTEEEARSLFYDEREAWASLSERSNDES